MTDTEAYLEAERWVREVGLPRRFPGLRFEVRDLPLRKRRDGEVRTFEFDAVSSDGSFVALVKASTGLTGGGKFPTAKTKDSYTDVLFLSMVRARRKVLVLTDPGFHEIFWRTSDGRIPAGIEIIHIPLPARLQARVERACRAARKEGRIPVRAA